MVRQRHEGTGTAERVTRHRRRLARSGIRRIEVTIPAQDAALVRELAAALRSGGEEGRKIRARLQFAAGQTQAKTGKELVAFFRASPLVGLEIEFERDGSKGRPVEL
jgi:phage tail tape-measure protein